MTNLRTEAPPGTTTQTISVARVVNQAQITPFHKRVFALCTLLMIVDGYDMISYGSVVQTLMVEWEMSPQQGGYLGAAALIGMLIGGIFVAPLADRFGRKNLLLGCLTASALASLGCALSFNFETLFAARTLVGVALGAMVPNFVAMTGEFAPQRIRSFAVCFVCSVYSIGGIIAGLLGMFLIPSFGWNSVFWVSVSFIVLAPVVWKFLPESPMFLSKLPARRTEFEYIISRISPDTDPTRVVAVEQPKEQSAPIVEIFRKGNGLNTLLIWVVFLMTMLLSYGLNTWLPTLMSSAGYSLGSGLFNLVVLNIGGFIGAVLGGWLADRFKIKTVILSYFVIATISLASLALTQNDVIVNILLMLAGATTVGTLSVIHALAADYYPSAIRSTGIGWAAGIGRIGAIAGPVLGGALLGLALPFSQNFLAVAVPGIIGALAMLFVNMSKASKEGH
ncbi:aromatic acid/H+ symport family MFS transporter [Corynebacterium sp. YIM 101645]|uniref:Aromatic acid/H+ symport family MFS transporter n=1 Tax=Corynebacterium lemuris TaxID=1859292 RepID=A0ABT2G1C1_9CORY|nr:aromatic acid/H+ symport family MFS transporter [Corynebacterium lemuris]MCS5480800.1 aromatic acid/H+ symport family MFS transporter [Corynebacterium lemuris]